jgi:amidohydrolase
MAIPMMIDSILMITLKLHRTTRVKYAAPLTILPLAGPNMRNIVTAALAVLAMLPAASPADSDLARIDRAAQDVAGKVVEWRRDFHRNPELSNREFRTAEKVSAHLRSLGLEVRTGVAHTGVVGVLRGGREGPVIALRADMDALPVTERADVPFRSTATAEYRGEQVGVMHACGHDGHTAILMGVAEALAGMRAELPGTVLFLFQPAEEGAPDGERGGATLMLEEGAFATPRPEAVFGLHLWAQLTSDQIGYRTGPMMAASDRYRIAVQGRQTHGSRPWGGVDPIVTASQIVLGMQTIVSRQIDITRYPAVLSVGAIKGGIRNNIIPDEVELIGTFRTFTPEARTQIIDSLTRTSRDIAASAGATATVEIATDNNPVVVNDEALTARMVPVLQRVAGADKVQTMPYVTGAEDFAYYAQEVPGFFFFVGVTPPGQDASKAPSNHSPLFYVDEASLQLGVKSLLAVSLDYLQKGAP